MSSDPKIVDHQFRSSKLSYEYGDDKIVPNKQEYWRVSLFFYKKPGISDEYFARHWHHVHADLDGMSKVFLDNNMLRYNQFCQNTDAKKLATGMACGTLLDFDAVTEFWVKDLQQFERCMKSDEWAVYTKDLDHFVDTEKGVKIMVGYDNIAYGEAVPGYGRDGVLRSDLVEWHRRNPHAGFANVPEPRYE